MELKTLSLYEINKDTVEDYTEEEISLLLNKLISDLPRNERSPYVQMINTAFEFRSISVKSRDLRRDLERYGFKFFPIPINTKLVMGVRRKNSK